MKKTLLLIAAVGLLMGTFSCSDDEPDTIRTVFTVNTPMVNHMVNMGNETVIVLSATHNKLTIDTIRHTASLELNYNVGQGDMQLKIEDITATYNDRQGVYELTSPTYKSFKGYVDFGESSMRYRYTTTGGIRIISVTPEVFFRKAQSIITYDDTTAVSTDDAATYQFTIAPATQTATIEVNGITHAKDLKFFKYIKSFNVPFTLTPNGFTISGTNLATNAVYIFYDFTTGNSDKSTDKYPFKTFDATIDLVNDHMDATYMIGGSATVVATGKTYPNYPSN